MKDLQTNYVVAADVGGTNTRMAIVNEDGVILALLKKSTHCKEGKDGMIKFLISFANEMIEKSRASRQKIRGIGVGFPGPLDAETGIIFNPPNLMGWDNVPLKSMLEEEFNIPVSVENDANAAALGEWWMGAGAGTNSLVCITLGTGVGGGIILDGKLLHGASGMAGEVGHMTIVKDGIMCTCGNRGCLEAYASARGIIERTHTALLKDNISNEHLPNSLEQICKMASDGNEIISNVIKEAGVILGIAIANLANLLNPEIVVLFGGVTNIGENLIKPVRKEVRKRAFKKATETLRIEVSKLPDKSGILGAAKSIFMKL